MARQYNLGESGTSSLLPKQQTSNINYSKIGVESGIKNSLSFAAQGAQYGGLPGAIGGFALGAGKGVIDYLKAKKLAHEEDLEGAEKYANDKSNFDESISGTIRRDAAIEDEETSKNLLSSGYSMRREGGSIDLMMDMVKDMRLERRGKKEGVDIHRSGGSVNVIAKGVLHEDKNAIGDRGIPIVTKDSEKRKVAEIEKNELVTHTQLSARIEELSDMHKKHPEDKEILKELGELMQKEILYNTVDNQGELM